jgi:hypothetical protein
MDSRTHLRQRRPLVILIFLPTFFAASGGFVAALAYPFWLLWSWPFRSLSAASNPSLSLAARSAAAATPSVAASDLTVRLARSFPLAIALSSSLTRCCAFWVALSFLSRARWCLPLRFNSAFAR